MRLPITVYGIREVVLFSLGWIAIGAVCLIWLPIWTAVIPAGLLLFTVSFFRDPHRVAPGGSESVVSPADGTVVEVGRVVENEFLKTECWKIGIFLSVFNVHVNRAPCGGRVEKIEYRKGRFLDARDGRSSVENESNSVVIRDGACGRRMLVRQISGAIARRIVCACSLGDSLERGQRFGMIKFGSRTELYIPMIAGTEETIKARVGDKVRGGETVVAVLTPVRVGNAAIGN